MTAHARLSPSSAHRWMRCAGSLALESGRDTSAFIGQVIDVDGNEFIVDNDMAGHVQVYVDNVREFAAGGQLLVEQRVNFSDAIDVPESFGTSDAVILTEDGEELQVHDLKYGRGVKVDAEHNEQLQLYALGALNDFGLVGDFKRVRMVIHQPRLQHISEWSCTVEELQAFGEEARFQADRALTTLSCTPQELQDMEALTPGEKQCRFCKVKATCPALRAEATGTVFNAQPATADEFAALVDDAPTPGVDTPEWLAACLAKCDLIEAWCKAIRAEAERRLIAGEGVPGFKLVEGRRGSRKWADEKAAEEALKAMRVKHDQMYDYSVISPTTAEKLAKAEVIGPRQWPKLQALITQSEGKPSVAPASDKRPAVTVAPTADEFSVVEG